MTRPPRVRWTFHGTAVVRSYSDALAWLGRFCGCRPLEYSDNRDPLVARKGGVTLVMRLIEGEFPNYSQVVPKEITRRVSLPSEILTQALRRVVLLSSERSRAVKFELSAGKLAISSSIPELGEASEELDIDYEGEPLTIGFNARYLLEALHALRTKEVTLGFQNDLAPAQIVPADDEDTLAVVMPMRI